MWKVKNINKIIGAQLENMSQNLEVMKKKKQLRQEMKKGAMTQHNKKDKVRERFRGRQSTLKANESTRKYLTKKITRTEELK